MAMIPRSHKQNILPHKDTFSENNILTRGQFVKDVDEEKAVNLILKPGEMSIHHGAVIHGSKPNKSKQRRIGFALQSYCPHGIEQIIGKNIWMPIRGEKEMIVMVYNCAGLNLIWILLQLVCEKLPTRTTQKFFIMMQKLLENTRFSLAISKNFQ